jgi:hypothetical protein
MTIMTEVTEPIFKTDTKGRVKTPPERREKLLDEFERSGLSGAKFAELAHIKYQTFAAWIARRRKQRGLPQAAAKKANTVQWLQAVVDLDTGAIVHAQVQLGDEVDHKELAVKAFEAQRNINRACGEALNRLTVQSLTSDKGYYAVSELQALQAEGIRTVIADPIDNRRLDKLDPAQKKAVIAARRSVKSKSGKALLRRRGMHIERSFAHILDCGGMRRATLRGWENLNKRFKLAAAFYNLSQLMRKLFGVGTPKQLAALGRLLFLQLTWFLLLPEAMAHGIKSKGMLFCKARCGNRSPRDELAPA